MLPWPRPLQCAQLPLKPSAGKCGEGDERACARRNADDRAVLGTAPLVHDLTLHGGLAYAAEAAPAMLRRPELQVVGECTRHPRVCLAGRGAAITHRGASGVASPYSAPIGSSGRVWVARCRSRALAGPVIRLRQNW